jgi:hypothetical protein
VELEFLSPGTKAELACRQAGKDVNDNDKNQKLGYDFLPEPKPNSEPLRIGLPSATPGQNAMLVAVLSVGVFKVLSI